jgi:type VI protein secretion system component Hcp
VKCLTANDSPTEELTFVCSAMEWAYTEYDANGRPKGEMRTQWDGRTGK